LDVCYLAMVSKVLFLGKDVDLLPAHQVCLLKY
jgi:hypothetical protein